MSANERSKDSRLLKLINNSSLNDKEIKNLLSSNRPHYSGKPYRFDGERVRFGLISDGHIGIKYYDHDLMDYAAKVFKKEKVDFVVHGGDILEGHYEHCREGSIFDLEAIGGDAQVEMAVNELSKIEVPIIGITGNHETNTFYRVNGFDIGKRLAERLKNFKYIGQSHGSINLPYGRRIDIIHPDGGTAYALCFDAETEIFTEEGWKLFIDLNKNEKVLTLNKDNLLEWQLPYSWTDEYYSGNMLVIDNPQFNLVITPNHRMLVQRPWKNKKNANEWKFIEAKNIRARQWKMLKTFPNWSGQEVSTINIPKPLVLLHGKLQTYKESFSMDDWLEFIGWYLSEGNLNKANKQVEISQDPTLNSDNYCRIVNCLKRMGLNPYCYGNKIRITSLQLFKYLYQFGHSHEKFIPKELKKLSKRQIEILLDALYRGDGCFDKHGKRQNYTTNSKQLADDIQELNHKLGYACTIKKYNERKGNFKQNMPIYQISIGRERGECEFGVDFKEVPYNGHVYCVSTQNEKIFIRRNGKCLWTGNSYKPQKIIESLEGGSKPEVLCVGHFHKAEYLFYRNIHCIQNGTLCSQTPFMKNKHISAHKGFWVVTLNVSKEGIKRISPEFYPAY